MSRDINVGMTPAIGGRTSPGVDTGVAIGADTARAGHRGGHRGGHRVVTGVAIGADIARGKPHTIRYTLNMFVPFTMANLPPYNQAWRHLP